MRFKFMSFWPSVASLAIYVCTALMAAITYALDIVSTATGVAWTALAGSPVAAAPQQSQHRAFQRRLGETRRRRRYRAAAYRVFGSPALA